MSEEKPAAIYMNLEYCDIIFVRVKHASKKEK